MGRVRVSWRQEARRECAIDTPGPETEYRQIELMHKRGTWIRPDRT